MSSSSTAEESDGYYGPPAPTEDAHAKAVRAWKRLTRRQRGNTDGSLMSEDGVSWMRGESMDTNAHSVRDESGAEFDMAQGEMRESEAQRKKKPVSSWIRSLDVEM